MKLSILRAVAARSVIAPYLAVVACMATTSLLATDLESYRFRYDFSSGEKVFFGSSAQLSDPLVSGGTPVYTRVYGPNGDSTAVHPSSVDWGTIGTATLNADWTLAMFARPGSVEGQVIVGLGRLNGDNKKAVVFSASSDPTKFKVYVEKRVPSNKKSHETTLTLDVGNTAGFHSIVAVHHAPPSGNKGMLQIYWDGVLKATYTMTTDIPFGDVMQFCASPSYFVSPCVTSTDNPDVAFHDVRFFSRAFTAADAAAYAAKYPAGTLRQCAYVQSASTNAVDTGYCTNPGTRYTADFQYLDNTKQARIFGVRDVAGCNLYVNGSTVFGYAMRDGGEGWLNLGVGVDYRRRVVTEDAFADSATIRLVQEPGGIVTKTLGGTHANTAELHTPLFAERRTDTPGPYACFSTARIYSFAIDETAEVDGENVVTPVHFFVPYNDATLGAGFTNIVAGTFHGEANGSVTPALSYCGVVGGVEDYKYEDGVLSAKIYVTSANPSKGLVQVGEDAATDAASFWLEHEGTVTLTAVPQGGAEFLGWFGDLGAIQGGGTATNLAITVKSASAAQFEARFGAGAWSERYDSSMPRFAKRAQDFDVGDYVQSGLVLHFDGIRNAGASAPHDPAATTWVNLGSLGAAQNAAKTTLASSVPSGAAAGEWADDGYAFKGKEYFALGGTVSLGSELTTQVSADYDESAQVANYPALFGATASSSRDDYFFYFNRVNNAGAVPVFKQNHAAARNMGRRYTGSHLTAIYDAPNSRVSVEDAVLPNWQAASTTAALGNWPYAIGTGRATDAQMGARMYLGKIRSVRVYNRVLDAAELTVNRIVDDARFCGKVEANVVVASNGAGLSGTEPEGDYMVNGSHTFTAPASVVKADGTTWTPTGYRIEVRDANGVWTVLEESSATEYAYTNCEARAQVRLTWNWKLADGVKKLDADDYAQAGLLLNFDGIRNAGLAAEHDAEAETWANLGSLGSAVDATNAVISSEYWQADSAFGNWTDRGYVFKCRNYFALKDKVALGSEATTQVVVDYDTVGTKHYNTDPHKVRWPCIFGAKDISNHFILYMNIDNNVDMKTYTYVLGNATYRNEVDRWDGRYINRIIESRSAKTDTMKVSAGASWNSASKAIPAGMEVGSHSLAIGTGTSTASGWAEHIYAGTVFAVRQYDRVLTDAEIQRNKAIDEARFFGRIGGLDETDVVLVKSESPGDAVTVADEGAYIIRGTGTKTFTAPETFTCEKGEYSCTGYRIETWDAAARVWNVDETSAARPKTFSGTSGAANRRLVWLWTLTQGIRSAADYTTADYVQAGLASNFDGINNYGATRSHYNSAGIWLNLADGGPDATLVATALSDPSKSAVAGSWAADGYTFGGKNHFALKENVAFGQQLSAQFILAYDHDSNIGSYPNIFGTTANTGRDDLIVYFDRSSGNVNNGLKMRPNFKLQNVTRHTMASDWTGPYLNVFYDDLERKKASISNAELPAWVKSNASGTLPSWPYTIGTGRNATQQTRMFIGKISSVRLYNRILTDDELHQNRKVDEIRFNNGFANYANLVVAYGANDDDIAATASLPAGEYEVTGSWPVTAEEAVADGHRYVPFVQVETWNNGGWTAAGRAPGASYTATDSAKVRLTYTWLRKRGFTLIVR